MNSLERRDSNEEESPSVNCQAVWVSHRDKQLDTWTLSHSQLHITPAFEDTFHAPLYSLARKPGCTSVHKDEQELVRLLSRYHLVGTKHFFFPQSKFPTRLLRLKKAFSFNPS